MCKLDGFYKCSKSIDLSYRSWRYRGNLLSEHRQAIDPPQRRLLFASTERMMRFWYGRRTYHTFQYAADFSINWILVWDTEPFLTQSLRNTKRKKKTGQFDFSVLVFATKAQAEVEPVGRSVGGGKNTSLGLCVFWSCKFKCFSLNVLFSSISPLHLNTSVNCMHFLFFFSFCLVLCFCMKLEFLVSFAL